MIIFKIQYKIKKYIFKLIYFRFDAMNTIIVYQYRILIKKLVFYFIITEIIVKLIFNCNGIQE